MMTTSSNPYISVCAHVYTLSTLAPFRETAAASEQVARTSMFSERIAVNLIVFVTNICDGLEFKGSE